MTTSYYPLTWLKMVQRSSAVTTLVTLTWFWLQEAFLFPEWNQNDQERLRGCWGTAMLAGMVTGMVWV